MLSWILSAVARSSLECESMRVLCYLDDALSEASYCYGGSLVICMELTVTRSPQWLEFNLSVDRPDRHCMCSLAVFRGLNRSFL